jgi:hypothetical protein
MTQTPLSPILFDQGLLGRRGTARVELGAPARLVSVVDTRECVLVNLSRSGALIRLARPLAIDACGYLRAGTVNAFVIITRVARASEVEGDTISGVRFDPPLTRDQFIELRTYSKEYVLSQKRLSQLAAGEWVKGVGR